MSDNKGDTIKKQQQVSTSPPDQLEESSELPRQQHHHHQQQPLTVVVSGGSPFIPSPLYVPTSSPFEKRSQPFECFNPKRPRFTGGQWKTLPSSAQKHAQMIVVATESSLSPTTQHTTNPPQPHSTACSSSDTAASSPPPAGQETTTKPPEVEQVHQHQYRKGKYVSPVWKPHEMLWLAKAWRVQYQGGGKSDHHGAGSSSRTEHPEGGEVVAVHSLRGKSRAEKDREVAEFLNKHGVNRDAKTAGTKWDNMLGEFRKVYEWERGTERDHVGKSYFRLSPYERKIHRLPASFDEEVFEALSQFMGPRMRTSHSSRTSSVIASGDDIARSSLAITGALPTKEDDPFLLGRTRQLMITSGGGEQVTFQGSRSIPGLLGFETSVDVGHVAGLPSSSSSSSRDVRRIGKIRMTWEESVSLWAEEGEHSRGRVRLEGSNFLNADELTFLDDAMVACTMEAFEDGPLKGFSVDRFVCGQQVKVFGRRKSSSSAASSEKVQLPISESSMRSFHSWEFQDPSEYYVGCLRSPPPSGLPGLLELSWHLQEPPPEELRFPLRKDVFMDLPQGKEIFFTTSTEPLDCRAFTYDILGPIIRTNSSVTKATSSSRECYIPLWDDCINRVVLKFCSQEFVLVRKPSSSSADTLQDSWPNVTGFVRNLCLWRGEETGHIRDNQLDPSSAIVEKLLWTYNNLPYILGYYAIGHIVTFCALSRSQDRVIRTDLYSLDLSSPAERLKALVPCYRIASLLPLLADRCLSNVNTAYNMMPYSDFERIDIGHGNIMEMTPNTVIRHFTSKKKWSAVKGIYDCLLDHAIPHVEFIYSSSNQDLAIVLKPRGCKTRPLNVDQLVEALMCVTKALVALHDVSFMHRDLSWDKVMRRTDREREAEWFICGFEEAASAPQIHPCMAAVATATTDQERVRHAPEMTRGLHGAKVDVWGIGHLIKTCGLITSLPKILRELQNKCLEQNPEQRPTAADCYHHLLQLQSSATL